MPTLYLLFALSLPQTTASIQHGIELNYIDSVSCPVKGLSSQMHAWDFEFSGNEINLGCGNAERQALSPSWYKLATSQAEGVTHTKSMGNKLHFSGNSAANSRQPFIHEGFGHATDKTRDRRNVTVIVRYQVIAPSGARTLRLVPEFVSKIHQRNSFMTAEGQTECYRCFTNPIG